MKSVPSTLQESFEPDAARKTRKSILAALVYLASEARYEGLTELAAYLEDAQNLAPVRAVSSKNSQDKNQAGGQS